MLCSFLRGSTPTIARHGLRETLLERRCEANSSSLYPSCLGCGLPRGSTATGDNQGRADMEESFLFPEYVPDSEPAVTLQDQLRELQQRQEEEERRCYSGGRSGGSRNYGTPGRCTRTVSREQYLELVTAALRRPKLALVLYVIDLLDLPDALLPHLPAPVGPKQLILLGNKVNLLPLDTPGYRQRLQERLWNDCARAGLLPPPGYRRPQHPSGDRPRDKQEKANPSPKSSTMLRDVRLISFKTGYGVEEFDLRAPAFLTLPRRRLCGWRHQRWQVHSLLHASGVRLLHRQGRRSYRPDGKSVNVAYSCGFQLPSRSHYFIGQGGHCWVAVTPQFKDKLHLRGYTPQGTVLTVRRPFLPHVVNIKGERVRRSVAYKTNLLPLCTICRKRKKDKYMKLTCSH
ncbi:hypothetical protein EI555_020349 [Monodon monoceros]|uniref:G domain-containing protein n=1 Tax=Monodon monoceros TaxID=40151 RepID=A0A4U1EEH3_MONMO|nr:hypothetical protein EI555_020349 [Monodon monoceros]